MPLSRYQIRNEYSLADPELYKTADKDDPEAVLEGIAMAGLVGVLRQLGDLAEFAAEIFHDLHEQVMVTASRGHNLMVRVQQLEVEFPAIEKALLCQTNHSSFYYNAGTDWHPNLRMDQNLITQGDLPRFVMDSYEECRGPPRLFLLDKFDVAGDGATLKRYTDPSFYKVDASFSNVVREKKTRKAKRKVSRWRNGETPETLPTSHAKLHQLFMEERLENGTPSSTSRVKLKRRLNGFPFDTKSGKSYMEKFLKTPSPDHDEVHQIPEDLSPLSFPFNNNYQSAAIEISVVSPEKESKQRKRNSDLSPAREETALALVVDGRNEVLSGEGCLEVSEPLGLQLYEMSSTSHAAVLIEREITVDGGSKIDDGTNDNHSDDVASEIDNYVDALASMDSENDTDSELRSKSNLHFMNGRGHPSCADTEDVQAQAHSADSLSMGHSTLSDDGSSSSKKDISSFYSSDAHSTSAENILDAEDTPNVQASKIHVAEPLPVHLSEDGELSQPPENRTSDAPNVSRSSVLDENAEVIVVDTTSVEIEKDDTVIISREIPFRPRSHKMSAESLDGLHDSATENDGTGTYHSIPSSPSKHTFSVQVPREKQFIDGDEIAVASTAEGFISPGTTDDPIAVHADDIPYQNELVDVENSAVPINLSDAHLHNRDDGSPTSSSCNMPQDGLGVFGSMESTVEKPILEELDYNNLGENIESSQNSDLPLLQERLSDRSKAEPDSCYSTTVVGGRVSEVDNSTLLAGEISESESCNPRDDAYVEAREMKEGASNLVDECCGLPSNVTDDAIVDPSTSEESDLSDTTKGTYLLAEVHVEVEEADLDSVTTAGCVLPSDVIDDAIVDPSTSESDLIASDTTAGTSLLPEVHVEVEEADLDSVTTVGTVSGHDDDSYKQLHEDYLPLIPDDHSGSANDTSYSNNPVESVVLDDAHQLHDEDDDLGLQTCNGDRYDVSVSESGVNGDEASTTSSAQQSEQSLLGVEVDTALLADDVPPMPPLPPVQWWLGDNPNAPPVHENIAESNNATAFSPPLSSSGNEEAQHAYPSLLQLSLSDVDLPEQSVCSTSSLLSTIPPLVHDGDQEDTLLPRDKLQLTGSVSQSSGSSGGKLHNNVQDEEGGKVEQNSDSGNTVRLVNPLNQTAAETTSTGLEHGLQSAHSEEIVATRDDTEISAMMVNGLRPTSEENASQPMDEGMQNGARTTKPPLPRNPMIDAIADVAHDKSKLRKVPERVQPPVNKEENSFVDLIRTKSYNLKPASATRANLQAPQVHLNVASMMSKVNKVILSKQRKAVAGSDDEDDDW